MIEQHAIEHIDTIKFPPNEGRSYDVVRGKYTKMAYGRLGQSWQNAEDAIQESYLKVLENPPAHEMDAEEFEAFFTTVVKSVCSDMMRNGRARELTCNERSEKYVQYLEVEEGEDEKSDRREEMVSLPDELSNPEDKQLAEEMLEFITHEIDKLKFKHRQIVALSVLYGYKPREITNITGDKPANVRKVIQRFRIHMKEKLQ